MRMRLTATGGAQRPLGGRRLVAALALLLSAGSIGACGATAASKTASTSHRPPSRPAAPAYRAGQYCSATKKAAYEAAGLQCRHHHLTRH